MDDSSTEASDHREDPEVHQFPIDQLILNLTPRFKAPDPGRVAELAEVIDKLPPILVERGTLAIVDGVHRRAAHKLKGRETVPGRYFDGSRQEAVAAAVRTNVTHGTPLTHAEKVHAAQNLLLMCPEWSDRRIADDCGLSHTTVADLRHRLTGQSVQLPMRMGRDGRRRPSDPAGVREKVAEAIRADLAAGQKRSLRELASEYGTSVRTASDVNRRVQRGEDPVPPKLRGSQGAVTAAGVPPPGAHSGPVEAPDLPGPELPAAGETQSEAALRLARSVEEQEPSLDDWAAAVEMLPAAQARSLLERVRTLRQRWASIESLLRGRLGERCEGSI